MDEMVNHYNDSGGHIESSKHGATTRRHIESSKHGATTRRHIESSNSYDEVASFNSIADAQTDMICHYDEVVNFDSMADTQIDMICHYDEVVNFDSMADNQNDSFVSLFLLFFQNYYFLTFDFEIRGRVMFLNTS